DESIMVDFNYDGDVLSPVVTDIPGKNELVKGEYEILETAGTIRIKITDLLSESLEIEVK
ncbi:MAG: site-specific DNA-methyltransferase, partial [Ruminococcus sp.]|nr:site-specific DNA-methyltransferase [Ruminococcus sp.]